jgi:hypothetical protein
MMALEEGIVEEILQIHQGLHLMDIVLEEEDFVEVRILEEMVGIEMMVLRVDQNMGTDLVKILVVEIEVHFDQKIVVVQKIHLVAVHKAVEFVLHLIEALVLVMMVHQMVNDQVDMIVVLDHHHQPIGLLEVLPVVLEFVEYSFHLVHLPQLL